ncbi:hypothetical protein J6590_104297 [Homalodisca vitripennis]|nr:hypothetical protein J6590_104297 [Homalodisca vitripennis]
MRKATLANRPTGNIVSGHVSSTAKHCLVSFWFANSPVTLHVPISPFYFFVMNKATLANRPTGNIVSRHFSPTAKHCLVSFWLANSPVMPTLHVPISLFYIFVMNKATLANRSTGSIVLVMSHQMRHDT